jgi:DNA mismatch repair protein MutS
MTTSIKDVERVSPGMKQFFEIKAQYPEALLLFRMGDFYETFLDDAETVSRVLDIRLTTRGYYKGSKMPMCGVPYHSADKYVPKLVMAGYRVAIAEQLENPAHTKKLVKRGVVRVLTPGTVVSNEILDPSRENPLVSLTINSGVVGLAVLEVSTGKIDLMEFPFAKDILIEKLQNISPSELLVPDLEEIKNLCSADWPFAVPTVELEAWRFEENRGRLKMLELLKINTLQGFDCEDLSYALGASGAALDYLTRNHVQLDGSIVRLNRSRFSDFMHVDLPTIGNLELFENMGGKGRGLLEILERTKTPMGSRTLRQWLKSPLLVVEKINERLESITELINQPGLRNQVSQTLKGVRDLERLSARVSHRQATPRDLGGIRDSLPALDSVKTLITKFNSPLLQKLNIELTSHQELANTLVTALEDELPTIITDKQFIKEGFDAKLDSLRQGVLEPQVWISGLEEKERELTGIKNLKVGFNRVAGYYIEITNGNRLPIPDHYVRKSTITNAERYITPELKERENVVLNGEQAILEREKEVFIELCDLVSKHAPSIVRASEALGQIDAILSLAVVAEENQWSRPVVDNSDELIIHGGRHPLVEKFVGSGYFVPNDTSLNKQERIMLITGPNMAGKSTYLRQVGLLVLLAQVGSFVPATQMKVGVVDRIFTRVGAQDNISMGLSTFMVEMIETSNIIHHATDKSLIVIDEIGRGTSTYDGMSIAQAVLEHLHDETLAKTLFATHFHELTSLAEKMPAVNNFRVEVTEEGDHVTFLHKIVPGGADRSYGIHVAQIAGLPIRVTRRAKEILQVLEKEHPLHNGRTDVEPEVVMVNQEEMDLVKKLNLEEMTPIAALNFLAKLKAKLDEL